MFPCQLELYQNDVNDKINVTGGFQQHNTFDGYVIPLVVQAELTRLPIRPYTDTEWDSLPHVLLTTDNEWEPIIMDHKFKEDKPWGDDGQPIRGNNYLHPFDDYENFWHYVVVQNTDCFQHNNGSIDLDGIIDQCVHYAHPPIVKGDTVVFYDVHGYEVDGYNDDDIQRLPYWDLTELNTEGAPLTLGNFVAMSDYVDSNLMHDVMTDKLVANILHLWKKNPLEWYFQKHHFWFLLYCSRKLCLTDN
jgi:hypothetical protein